MGLSLGLTHSWIRPNFQFECKQIPNQKLKKNNDECHRFNVFHWNACIKEKRVEIFPLYITRVI